MQDEELVLEASVYGWALEKPLKADGEPGEMVGGNFGVSHLSKPCVPEVNSSFRQVVLAKSISQLWLGLSIWPHTFGLPELFSV